MGKPRPSRSRVKTIIEAQLHVDDVQGRLNAMSSDDPEFEPTLDELDHALLARTEAEKAHGC